MISKMHTTMAEASFDPERSIITTAYSIGKIKNIETDFKKEQRIRRYFLCFAYEAIVEGETKDKVMAKVSST